jgi:hypothetical protein
MAALMSEPTSAPTLPPATPVDSSSFNIAYLRGSHPVLITRNVTRFGFRIADTTPNTRPDDDAFKVPGVALAVPRGLCCIYDNVTNQPVCIVRGVRKFGYKADSAALGWVGWSDDCSVNRWIFTEKENGCCFHLSAFIHAGEFYWVIGSKNVHMIFSTRDQVSAYTEVRYGVASVLAYQWLDMVDKMAPAQVDDIKSWILTNSLTLVGESIRKSDQHIVAYDETVGDTIRFFNAISSPIHDTMWVDDVSAFIPHASHINGGMFGSFTDIMATFDRFGLPRVEFFVAASNVEKEALAHRFAAKINSEGAVVYVVNDAGHVTGMFKHKNHVYIVLRRMREQMRNNAALQVAMRAVNNLFTEGIVDQSCLPSEFADDIKPMYAFFMVAYGGRFTQNIHRYPEIIQEFYARKTEKDWVMEALRVTAGSAPGVILCGNGVPGSGKTTLFETIARTYNGTYIDQDMHGGNARMFVAALDKLAKALKGKPVPECGFHLVAVGKRLVSFQTYSQVVNAFPTYAVVFCDFARDPDDLAVYYERALSRSGPGSSLNVISDDIRREEASGHTDAADALRTKLYKIVTGSANGIEVPSCVVPLHIPRDTVEANVARIVERITAASTSGAASTDAVSYVSLKCPTDAVMDAISDVDASGYELHGEVHVTLAFRPSADIIREFESKIGSEVTVQIVSVHRGASFITAKIDMMGQDSLVLTKRTPHITLGRKKGVHGVKQYESPNAFLEDVDGVSVGKTVTGVIQFAYQ